MGTATGVNYGAMPESMKLQPSFRKWVAPSSHNVIYSSKVSSDIPSSEVRAALAEHFAISKRRNSFANRTAKAHELSIILSEHASTVGKLILIRTFIKNRKTQVSLSSENVRLSR
jgi:hypothetical protein